MTKFTKKQIIQWSVNLHNDFKLDTNRLCLCDEKQAIKWMELPDGRRLKISIVWREALNGNQPGFVQPCMHLSIWKDAADIPGLIQKCETRTAVSVTKRTYRKKRWDVLTKLTSVWNDEKILAAAAENTVAFNDATA